MTVEQDNKDIKNTLTVALANHDGISNMHKIDFKKSSNCKSINLFNQLCNITN